MDTAMFEVYVNMGLMILILLLVLIVVIVLGAVSFILIKKYLSYGTKVFIMYKDASGQTKWEIDKGGVFAKFKLMKFWLKKYNMGLDADNIETVEIGRKKYCFLARIGRKSFRPLKMRFNDDNLFMTVGEEDVNWAITELYVHTKRFDWKGFWSQWGNYILWGITLMVVTVLLIWMFRQFPEILKLLGDVLKVAKEIIEDLEVLKIGERVIE